MYFKLSMDMPQNIKKVKNECRKSIRIRGAIWEENSLERKPSQ
jgi:hypothetical protein